MMVVDVGHFENVHDDSDESLNDESHQVMSILLKLVDTDAANVNGLTNIGNSLLG